MWPVSVSAYICTWALFAGEEQHPSSPLTSLSLQPSGGRRQQMNSLNTDDHPRCIVLSVWWSVTASISHPMLQWTNRLTWCTKITISIRFDFQSKKRFQFRFRWSMDISTKNVFKTLGFAALLVIATASSSFTVNFITAYKLNLVILPHFRIIQSANV